MKRSNLKFFGFVLLSALTACSNQPREELYTDSINDVTTEHVENNGQGYTRGNTRYYTQSDYHSFMDNIQRRIIYTRTKSPEGAVTIENTKLIILPDMYFTLKQENDSLSLLIIDNCAHQTFPVTEFNHVHIPNRIHYMSFNETLDTQVEIISPTEANFFVHVRYVRDKKLKTIINVKISDNTFKINNVEIAKFVDEPASDVKIEDMYLTPYSFDNVYRMNYFRVHSYDSMDGKPYTNLTVSIGGPSAKGEYHGIAAHGWKRVKLSDTHYQIHIRDWDGYGDSSTPVHNDQLFASGLEYHTFDLYLKKSVGADNTIKATNIEKIKFRAQNLRRTPWVSIAWDIGSR